MARLRQQNPQNYVSSSNISTEFENVIRYLNAAELGNKTLGELLGQLFDEDGEFSGPVELRFDSSNGLQYRIGEYTQEDAGWTSILSYDQIRGPAGQDVGEIGAPILFGRTDWLATSGQTVFSYAHASDDSLVIFVNGILQVPGVSFDYVSDATADTFTFASGLVLNDKVTAYRIRATSVTGFARSDFVTTSTQSLFPFVHDDTTVLQVYKNGILQRPGGAHDYVANPATDSVTFLTPIASGNTVSIITVENTATTYVTGLMLEETYADPADGLILYSKLKIADGAIAQAKVSGLVSALSTSAKLTAAATAPVSPNTGDLWVDTSTTPNALKFYSGTAWISTTPESTLPSFTSANAGQHIVVNNAGTGLVYAPVDFSSVIPLSQKAAANGVATLDSASKLPVAQLPSALSSLNFFQMRTGSTANGTYQIQRVFKTQISLTGMSVLCASGTASIQLAINGVGVGSVYAVTSTPNEVTFTSAQAVNASVNNARIGYIITSASSLTDLEVVFSAQVTG